MKRCVLHAHHAGPHLFVATKSTMTLLGDCEAKTGTQDQEVTSPDLMKLVNIGKF
jgi:hypothetical protein